MDKKYVVSITDQGIINWVGINTPTGLVVKKITDQDNAIKFMNQLREIDDEYGSLLSDLKSKNVTIRSNKFFEKEEKKISEEVEPVPARPRLQEKILSNKRGAAIALAMIVGSAVIVSGLTGKLESQLKNVKAFGSNLKANTLELFTGNNVAAVADPTVAEEDTEVYDVEGKTVPELIDMLNEDDQERAFTKIVKTQDHFNEVAAPTVSPENGKQLYWTFDEVAAAYLYANVKTSSTEKLASFFGTSKIYLKDKENDVYEQMDADRASESFTMFSRELGYYYLSGATVPSGIVTDDNSIFEREEEAEFFAHFENLILAYNKDHSQANKDALRAALEDIYMNGSPEGPKEKYPGAVSIIGTAALPYLHFHGVITREEFERYVEMNETITCDDIFSEIEKVFNCKLESNGKEAIIEQIARLQNEKIKRLDRNYELQIIAFDSQELEEGSYIDYSEYSGTKTRTTTKHWTVDTKDRKKAVKLTSEKEVQRAEKEADKEIEEKNEKEEKKAEELKEGYEDTYDDAFNNKGDNRDEGRSDDYNKGADEGVKAGEEDRKKAEEDMEEYNKTHEEVREEVISEEFTKEDNTPQNPEPDKPEPEIKETVEEDPIIHGDKPQTQAETTHESTNKTENTSTTTHESSSTTTHESSSTTTHESSSTTTHESSSTTTHESSSSNNNTSSSKPEPKVVETVEEDTTIYGAPKMTGRQKVVSIKRYIQTAVETITGYARVR